MKFMYRTNNLTKTNRNLVGEYTFDSVDNGTYYVARDIIIFSVNTRTDNVNFSLIDLAIERVLYDEE